MSSFCYIAVMYAILPVVLSTTEWWGDLRAHLNPPRAPAFYDVTYDDTDCPQGLRYDAIPDYVFFGTMIASLNVEDHDECVQKCLEKQRCKSVNYFMPVTFQEQGFCELLAETQLDNPRLMKPFIKATYYENIRCRDTDHVDVDATKPAITRPSKDDISSLMKKINTKPIEFRARFRAARK